MLDRYPGFRFRLHPGLPSRAASRLENRLLATSKSSRATTNPCCCNTCLARKPFQQAKKCDAEKNKISKTNPIPIFGTARPGPLRTNEALQASGLAIQNGHIAQIGAWAPNWPEPLWTEVRGDGDTGTGATTAITKCRNGQAFPGPCLHTETWRLSANIASVPPRFRDVVGELHANLAASKYRLDIRVRGRTRRNALRGSPSFSSSRHSDGLRDWIQ